MSNDNEKLAAEQAAGLRALADMVEAHPELAGIFKYAFQGMGTHLFENAAETMARFATIAARSGLDVHKRYGNDAYASVTAKVNDRVSLRLQTDREEVCTRVVTGTEAVTKTVKDPALLAKVPEIDVTEEVEVFEWKCLPLLAAEGGDS